MDMDKIAGRLLALSAFGVSLCAAAPARADLRMCNNTNNRVSVALGYTDGQNWVSEGWWNLKSLDCVTLLRGALAAEFYYLYAMDERGGEWKGKVFMCTSDREFKIDGPAGLLCARLQPNRVLRSRHRQGLEELDGAADRPGEPLSRTSSLIAARRNMSVAASAADCRENASAVPPPPRQDYRHARPCFSRPQDHRGPVRRRRGRLPHQHEPCFA